MQLFGGNKNGKHKAGASPARDSGIKSESGAHYGARPTGSPEEYTRRQEKKSSGRWAKRVVTALLVVALVAVVCVVGFKLWVKAPDILSGRPSTHTPDPETSAPVDTDPGASAVVPTEEPIEGEAPDVVNGSHRDGVYTFAVIGLDVADHKADTNLLGMFDTKAGKLNFVTIPRDTLINSGYDYKKLNYVYAASYNQGKDALGNHLTALERIMGYPLDCYAVVDITAAADLINAVGGIWFDLPRDMYYDGWNQDPPIFIDLKKGNQLLSGEDAVKVYRYRLTSDKVTGLVTGGYPGGDIERVQTQYALLKAMMEQMLTLGNIPNLSKAISIYEEKVTTNLTARNLAFFAQEFLKLDAEDITFQTFPADPDLMLYETSYVNPYIDQWVVMLNEYFNPFNVEITTANLDMMSYNSATDSFYTTTGGDVRGGRYSFHGAQA